MLLDQTHDPIPAQLNAWSEKTTCRLGTNHDKINKLTGSLRRVNFYTIAVDGLAYEHPGSIPQQTMTSEDTGNAGPEWAPQALHLLVSCPWFHITAMG